MQQVFQNVGQSTRLIFIAATALLTIIMGSLVYQSYQNLQLESAEVRGLAMLNATEKLNLELGEYQGACTAYLAGANFSQVCDDQQHHVQQAFQALTEDLFSSQGIYQQYQKLAQQWSALDANKDNLSAVALFDQVSRLLQLNLNMMSREYAVSGLELYSDEESYHLGRLIADVIPSLQNDLAMLRGYGSQLITSNQRVEGDTIALIQAKSNIERTSQVIKNIQFSMSRSDKLSDDLQQAFQKTFEQIEYLMSSNVDILLKQKVTTASGVGNYFSSASLPIVELTSLHRQLSEKLISIVKDKYLQHQTILLLLVLGYIVLLGFLGFLYRRMDAAIDNLTQSEARLRKVSEAKSEFLGNMSHELRTPLNGIYGVLQIIDGDKDQPRHLRKLTKIALESTELLTGLIGNVLDMEKIENRDVTLDDDEFVLNILLESYTPIFRNLAEKNNVLLTVSIAPDCHLYWRGDKLRIMQILNNVVGNAIKFSAGKTVEFNAWSTDKSLCFVVKDTGRGMDSETLNNLFKRFQKGRFNAAEGIESTGLGMAITKQLVDLMGGSIQVTSQLNEGSEFVIDLPLQVLEAPLNPEQAILKAIQELTDEELSDIKDWRDCHVLLVDDAMTNLFVIEAMLATMVRKVSIASSGYEALEVFAQDQVDMLVSDISMPGMDGMTLLAKVRDFQPYIPAIALSGNVMRNEIIAYKKAGYDDVLAKPVQKRELQAAMEKVFMLKQAEKNGDMPSPDNLTLH